MSDDLELVRRIARTGGIEVLMRDCGGCDCDGCGFIPHDDISICRLVDEQGTRMVCLCSDCIAESWARAPSQRDRRSAEEGPEVAERREQERVTKAILSLLRDDPKVHAVLRDIVNGRPMAAELAAGRGVGVEDEALIGADT